jgi:hypothetical protein
MNTLDSLNDLNKEKGKLNIFNYKKAFINKKGNHQINTKNIKDDEENLLQSLLFKIDKKNFQNILKKQENKIRLQRKSLIGIIFRNHPPLYKADNEKFKTNGIISLYQGAFANGFLTLIGHYPWFVVHNYLNNYIPKYEDKLFKNLLRNAFIGFLSSFISDGITNSFRVIKTAKQTDKNNKGYYEIGEEIIKKNGFKGLFFRGLETRILTNGIQGLMFNVLWKFFDINKKSKANISIDLKDKN